MRKLILDEEYENPLAVDNMINSLIKGEWDAIELYNSMLVTIETMEGDYKAVADTISDIVKEEYVHIGQLEKVLQDLNPAADSIKDGAEEAAETIAES